MIMRLSSSKNAEMVRIKMIRIREGNHNHHDNDDDDDDDNDDEDDYHQGALERSSESTGAQFQKGRHSYSHLDLN